LLTHTTAAPSAFAAIGWKYYIIFIIVTSAIGITAFFYFPEVSQSQFQPHGYTRQGQETLTADFCLQTKGKSLEDIQAIFGDDIEPYEPESVGKMDEESAEKHHRAQQVEQISK
jgi:hypothetical protein